MMPKRIRAYNQSHDSTTRRRRVPNKGALRVKFPPVDAIGITADVFRTGAVQAAIKVTVISRLSGSGDALAVALLMNRKLRNRSSED